MINVDFNNIYDKRDKNMRVFSQEQTATITNRLHIPTILTIHENNLWKKEQHSIYKLKTMDCTTFKIIEP